MAVFVLFLLMDLSKSYINGGAGAGSKSGSGASVATVDSGHIRATAANSNNNVPEVDLLVSDAVSSEKESEQQDINEMEDTMAFPQKKNDTEKDEKDKDTKKNEEAEEGLMRAFEKFDANGDGTISREEVKNILEQFGQSMTEVQLDAVMLGADTDGDGTIKFDEFKRAWGDEDG